MYRNTTVPLPRLVRSDDDVQDWLSDNTEAWETALDRDVHYIDGRANYVSHAISRIDVTDGKVHVEYEVEYYMYYGCRDLNDAGIDEREISGDVRNGQIHFVTFVQPDEQAPNEEL